MAKTRLTNINEVIQVDFLFWNDNIVLHIIDECTRFSMAGIIADKSPDELCRGLRHWWFKIFQLPKTLICDQEGAVASDAVGLFLQRFEVTRKLKTTDLHATLVERHHAFLRQLLHSIEAQSRE